MAANSQSSQLRRDRKLIAVLVNQGQLNRIAAGLIRIGDVEQFHPVFFAQPDRAAHGNDKIRQGEIVAGLGQRRQRLQLPGVKPHQPLQRTRIAHRRLKTGVLIGLVPFHHRDDVGVEQQSAVHGAAQLCRPQLRLVGAAHVPDVAMPDIDAEQFPLANRLAIHLVYQTGYIFSIKFRIKFPHQGVVAPGVAVHMEIDQNDAVGVSEFIPHGLLGLGDGLVGKHASVHIEIGKHVQPGAGQKQLIREAVRLHPGAKVFEGFRRCPQIREEGDFAVDFQRKRAFRRPSGVIETAFPGRRPAAQASHEAELFRLDPGALQHVQCFLITGGVGIAQNGEPFDAIFKHRLDIAPEGKGGIAITPAAVVIQGTVDPVVKIIAIQVVRLHSGVNKGVGSHPWPRPYLQGGSDLGALGLDCGRGPAANPCRHRQNHAESCFHAVLIIVFDWNIQSALGRL